MNSRFACGHRVKFDLFRRYGAIAATGDRYLAEFMRGRVPEGPGYRPQLDVHRHPGVLAEGGPEEPAGQEPRPGVWGGPPLR